LKRERLNVMKDRKEVGNSRGAGGKTKAVKRRYSLECETGTIWS
jgi:hypothetical protein